MDIYNGLETWGEQQTLVQWTTDLGTVDMGGTTDPGTVDNRPGYWVQWTTDLGTVDVGDTRPGYSGHGGTTDLGTVDMGGHKTWVLWTRGTMGRPL